MRQGGEFPKRVVIEGVKPEIDCGRFSIKRTVGEQVAVEADIFTDGHDAVSAALLYRKEGDPEWTQTLLEPLVNDRWRGSFRVSEPGRYFYTLKAWVDPFKTWQRDLGRKLRAGQNVAVDLRIGAEILTATAGRAAGPEAEKLREWGAVLESAAGDDARIRLAQSREAADAASRYPAKEGITPYGRELTVIVDREKARFSSWYEMFPRSCGKDSRQHGTFKDCESRLAYVASMGFDVLYLPPIHPIGRSKRKGRNNLPSAAEGDVGSPWAIGSEEGGHNAVHPGLGTIEEFRSFLRKAGEAGLEIAMDLAFQCAPDHPYTQEHPEWFRWRPDGTVQFAENPPKKYEDIIPFDFQTESWRELWEELRRIVFFWLEEGVRIFRVDNPHTKPFPFWEWLIAEVKKDHPEAIFLAEAFTRPKVMYRLAKLGFTQSYTYFTWRNTKWEMAEYFKELTGTEVREFFRPSLWPNTPDILTENLQMGGRPAFMARLVLAATLGANYGIYGPAFELGENIPREPGSEEYADSEKYEIRAWNTGRPDSLKDFIARINRIRRENPALQRDHNLRFHPVDNDQLICYSKHTEDLSDFILVVVNLDPRHIHSGWLELPLSELDIQPRQTYQVHDLLGEGRYLWTGARNYVEINPHIAPAQVFRLRRRVRSERDFDYFL